MDQMNQAMMKSLGTEQATTDASFDAQSQVNDIKQNATALLCQLMLDQNEKLRMMVDALKKKPSSAALLGENNSQSLSTSENLNVHVGDNAQSAGSDVQSQSLNELNAGTLESKADEVSSSHLENGLHLDVLLDRINATMIKNIDGMDSIVTPVVKQDLANDEFK